MDPNISATVTLTMLNQTTDSAKTSNISIQDLNHEKVMVLLPVIIIVCIFMVFGLIGNLIVCYVYYFRMKKTPSHYFVLFLATLDLVSCCIGMPSELGDLLQPLTFSSAYACKFLRFVLSFTIISSCITLICVAFDRYYKVCKPLKGFPVGKVKVLCGVSVLIGLGLSWPALVLYGVKTVQTHVPGIEGSECSTSDGMKGTPFPIIYYATLLIAFIVTFSIFVILYSKIGYEIRRRRKMAAKRCRSSAVQSEFIRKRELTNSSVLSDDESTSAISDDDHKNRLTPVRKTNSLSQLKDLLVQPFIRSDNSRSDTCESTMITSEGTLTKSEKLIIKRRKKSPFRSIRTTYIFLAVFIAFIISFVPYLICNILRYTKVAFYGNQSHTEEVLYNLFVRSYFISNFINPIIYSVLNRNFRLECKKFIRKCTRRCRSS